MTDEAFAGLPFDDWLKSTDQSHIHWTAGVSQPSLSTHQRMSSRIFVEVEGRELARRRGEGTLLVLVQISDQQGHKWQNHQDMDLEKVQDGVKANDAVFSYWFFALPGDYQVAIALYDTATHEHAINRKHLHVNALKSDPIPGSWRDLPPIEFIANILPPDVWFLPEIESGLHLSADNKTPLHISLLVNLTPSERQMGSVRVQNRNLSSLIPAAKILAAVDWGKSLFNVELVDIGRRKTLYADDHRGIDWQRASGALADLKPGLIDVNSLQNRWYTAQFFLDAVAHHLMPHPQRNVLIILSSAVEFNGGQETRPFPADLTANAAIYYIRYQPLFYPLRRAAAQGGPPPRLPARPEDHLAPMLRSLNPHLYEVETPEQFRKVLAAMLSDISNL